MFCNFEFYANLLRFELFLFLKVSIFINLNPQTPCFYITKQAEHCVFAVLNFITGNGRFVICTVGIQFPTGIYFRVRHCRQQFDRIVWARGKCCTLTPIFFVCVYILTVWKLLVMLAVGTRLRNNFPRRYCKHRKPHTDLCKLNKWITDFNMTLCPMKTGIKSTPALTGKWHNVCSEVTIFIWSFSKCFWNLDGFKNWRIYCA